MITKLPLLRTTKAVARTIQHRGNGSRSLVLRRHSYVGFTLLEILVALSIFAIIGVISSQLMSQTVRANEKLTDRGVRLTEVHRAMQAIQRDLMQLTDRSIRDEYGDSRPPLLIGTDGTIEFSRSGWRNPLKLPRAEVQRVAYRWQDNKLLRGYWTVLDRVQDSEPVHQTLLTDVERVEFFALDVSGNEYMFWPDPSSATAQQALGGIIMRIEMAPFGVVERVWEVPSVGS